MAGFFLSGKAKADVKDRPLHTNDVSTSWGLPSDTTYVERGICEIIP